jgi:ring-1,2-phenylacetyl-CoA epoxidase subunit PaaC
MSSDEAGLVDVGVAVDRSTLKPIWEQSVSQALTEAMLTRPADSWMSEGGRDGLHGEDLGHMLAEMQSLQRMHPGLTW